MSAKAPRLARRATGLARGAKALAWLCGLGVACALALSIDASSQLNPPRAEGSLAAGEPGVLMEFSAAEAGVADGFAFVGLAISGGGSRAANFAASVMGELDRLGILEHVSVISSVSGGSVAASYFATRAQDPLRASSVDAFWARAEGDLTHDFLTDWLLRWSRHDRLLRTLSEGYTRSTVMADIFHERLLGQTADGSAAARAPLAPGAEPRAAPGTFGSLPATGPRLVINATAMSDLAGVERADCTNRGWRGQGLRLESVSFSSRFFHDCLNSDRSSYRIADAVMASAAFPGVFNAVTLAAHPKPLARGSEGHRGDRQFLHLLDGGPSDNLGLEGIFSAASEELSSKSVRAPRGCLIIVIDAFASGDPDERGRLRDPRGAIGRVVDTDFFDSIDAMLARRRFDTLQRLGVAPSRLLDGVTASLDIPSSDGEPARRVARQRASYTRGISLRDAVGDSNIEAETWKGHTPELLCDIWHIALDNVQSLMLGESMVNGAPTRVAGAEPNAQREVAVAAWARTEAARHRMLIWELTSRLRTSFKLSGPEGCGQRDLADAVWEAGRLSVQEDYQARAAACQWLDGKGWGRAGCSAPPKEERKRTVSARYVLRDGAPHTVRCGS